MIELLASRGHSLRALLDEYPISTVLALSKSAQVNRMFDLMAHANAVAVGAVHAVEAGFSGKQPKVLRSYMEKMNRQVKKVQAKGQGTKDDAQALFAGFAGTAVMEKTSGRRKNRPTGSS